MIPDHPFDPFETHRRRLFALAYRILGSASDADDILQEAWLRLAKVSEVRAPGMWLTTCVSRLCIDRLRSAQKRREVYTGPWLPEPVRTDSLWTDNDHANPQLVSLALLHVMERLSPKERAVYVLHEAFDYTHAEIAETIGLSAQASRKALSRARKRVQGQVRFAPSRTAHQNVLMRFSMAVQLGDISALESLLVDDVKAITDAGGKVTAALRVVHSRSHVARFFVGIAKKSAPKAVHVQPIDVNGWPALLIERDGARQLLILETDGTHIFSVFLVMNPDKLVHLL